MSQFQIDRRTLLGATFAVGGAVLAGPVAAALPAPAAEIVDMTGCEPGYAAAVPYSRPHFQVLALAEPHDLVFSA